MKKTIVVAIAGVAVGALAVLAVQRTEEVRSSAEVANADSAPVAEAVALPADTQFAAFSVPGISCGSCEGKLRQALTPRPEVRDVRVDLRSRTVWVAVAPGAGDLKGIADDMARIGYPARYLAGAGAPPRPSAGGGGCGGNCCGSGQAG